jgi:hypothetical protein
MSSDFDIAILGGGVSFRAIRRPYAPIDVTDGFVTIKFRDNVPLKDYPKISAIEVVQAATTPVAVATKAPVTKAPVTRAPVTKAPVTKAPVTKAPVTKAPVTKAPVTKAPVTQAPVAKAPVMAPVIKAPVPSRCGDSFLTIDFLFRSYTTVGMRVFDICVEGMDVQVRRIEFGRCFLDFPVANTLVHLLYIWDLTGH